MRFLEDGPDIPDELLFAADEGELVFFCGAGVSKTAEMPDFEQLTKSVVKHFYSNDNLSERAAFGCWKKDNLFTSNTTFEEMYDRLFEEYGVSNVKSYVAKTFIESQNGMAQEKHINHANLVTIASRNTQYPKILTTNFDHLFERSFPSSNVEYLSPSVLNACTKISNSIQIIYLHGRMNTEFDSDDICLDRADLAGAYISPGWATHILHEVLDKYKVVMIGYSAGEVPAQYLLKSFARGVKMDIRKNLYAFAHVENENLGMEGQKLINKFKSLGIKPIKYDLCENGNHNNLWNTISEWAKRSKNLEQWCTEQLKLARKKTPGECKPFQRGIFQNTLQTKIGSNLIQKLSLNPKSEWLLVLDSKYRRLKDHKSNKLKKVLTLLFNESDYDFNPADFYKTDRDRVVTPSMRGCFGIFQDMDPSGDFASNHEKKKFIFCDEQLENISTWIKQSLRDSIVLWIFSKQEKKQVPSIVIDQLRCFIEENFKSPEDSRIYLEWQAILEYLSEPGGDDERYWGCVYNAVRGEWSESLLEVFEKKFVPTYHINNRSYWESSLKPNFPDEGGEVDFSVYFPNCINDLETYMKDREVDLLKRMFEIFEKCMLCGIEKMRKLKIENAYFESDLGLDGFLAHHTNDNFLNFIKGFFKLLNLIKEEKHFMEERLLEWNSLNSIYLTKIQLHAACEFKLFSSDFLFGVLMNSNLNTLCHESCRGETVRTLEMHWQNLSFTQKQKLEEFLSPNSEKKPTVQCGITFDCKIRTIFRLTRSGVLDISKAFKEILNKFDQEQVEKVSKEIGMRPVVELDPNDEFYRKPQSLVTQKNVSEEYTSADFMGLNNDLADETDEAGSEFSNRNVYSTNPLNASLNSPQGDILINLMEMLLRKNRRSGIPAHYKVKFEQFLKLDGIKQKLSVVYLSAHSEYFYKMDKEWTLQNLVPHFSPDSDCFSYAWNGYLMLHWNTTPKIFNQIKHNYLDLFKRLHKFKWEDDCDLLALKHLYKIKEFGDVAKVPISRLLPMQCLKEVESDFVRYSFLNFLSLQFLRNCDQRKNVVNFIKYSWPKGIAYRSELENSAWFKFICKNGTHFKDLFQVFNQFISKEHSIDHFAFYEFKKSACVLLKNNPDSVMKLLMQINIDQLLADQGSLHEILKNIKEDQISGQELMMYQKLKNTEN